MQRWTNHSQQIIHPINCILFQFKDCQGTVLIHTDFYACHNGFENHLDEHVPSYKSPKHSLLRILLYVPGIREPMLSIWASFPQEADEGCSCRGLGQSCISARWADKIPTALILRRPTPTPWYSNNCIPPEAYTQKDSSMQRLTSTDRKAKFWNSPPHQE